MGLGGVKVQRHARDPRGGDSRNANTLCATYGLPTLALLVKADSAGRQLKHRESVCESSPYWVGRRSGSRSHLKLGIGCRRRARSALPEKGVARIDRGTTLWQIENIADYRIAIRHHRVSVRGDVAG